MHSIARRRLASQQLVAPRLTRVPDVVRLLGAVQAQDFPYAKWAIAQRTKDLVDRDVEAAFTSGAILRTHVLRPTWHFLVPEDARWMLELTGPRVQRSMSYYGRQLGLDAAAYRKSYRALERALRDGQQLTREELRPILKRAGVPVSTGQHLGRVLIEAETSCAVISGARRGKQFTYALFDERVPATPRRDRDDALHELTRRYFATRSPATVHDFAWWSGLTIGDAQRGIDAAGRALTRETLDGRVYWASGGARETNRAIRIAHLLPNYDEYFIGFKDRSAFGERLSGTGKLSGKQLDALSGHVLCVNGQIVGGWGRPSGKDRVITLNLLLKLTGAERQLVNRAAQRFGEFLGAPVRLR
jgi:hypothetical protein